MRWLTCLSLFAAIVAVSSAQDAPEALLKKAKAVLAQIEGKIAIPGLKEPVEVLRDRWGVPHIYAKNADDLFFAQGFVAAQDRLFQLDMWRRLGRGETAEVFGPEALNADRFARLVRYRGDMDDEWNSYSRDTKQIATAFARGINAHIDHIGKNLPIEFQLLGIAPGKWQPEDILTRMSGIIMSRNFSSEIARAQLIQAVGVEKANWLAPTDPEREYAPAPGLNLAGIDERILAGYHAATKVLNYKPAKTESNNWVVAANRSVSGKPLLASDPHRAIAAPSLRYLVHLNAPGWNVIGAGEPALPGVALGHNERIAWGFTIVGTDQADFYVEEVNPKNADQYKVGDKWGYMKVVHEKVPVKGQVNPAPVDLRFTRHGPVIYQDFINHRAYALKWAGSEPGGAAYLGSLAVGRASNQPEFLQALNSWKIPGLNFMYADKDDNIGWVAAALTPIKKHDGLLPVPGKNSTKEWSGFLPVKDLPQSFNPKRGWLGTANHNILYPGYKHQIAYEWAPPYRFDRLQQVLDSKPKWDLKDFQAVQHDVKSLPGMRLVALLKKQKTAVLTPYHPLAEWNGDLGRDSKAGPFYAVWLNELQDALYGAHVPKKLVPVMRSLGGVPMLLHVLENPDKNWFGDNPVKARDDLLVNTFNTAFNKVQKLLPDAKDRPWGKLHTVTFRHNLAALSPAIAKAFNVGPFERGGDANTLNNTRFDETYQQVHGATYRHLFDLADWDRGLATSSPGQSGQPGSPHYADLAPLWADQQYFPLFFSRSKVEEATQHRLTLQPAK